VPYQPGQTGNPNGAKKPRIITNAILAELKKTNHQKVEKIQRLAEKIVACALEGQPWAVQTVLDRAEGKVPQPIAGSDDQPARVLRTISWVIREPKPVLLEDHSDAKLVE